MSNLRASAVGLAAIVFVAAGPAFAGAAVQDLKTSAPRIRACNSDYLGNAASVGYDTARGLYSECLSFAGVQKVQDRSRTPKTNVPDDALTQQASLSCHTYRVSVGGISAPRVCMTSAFSK